MFRFIRFLPLLAVLWALPAHAEGRLAIVDAKGQTQSFCPLKHTDVKAQISGFVARVHVEQEFTNPSRTAIEAVYTFPLPDDAAVDGMTMRIGKRIVKGEIKKREEARQIYQAAKDAGQSAALLDQERSNVFTQSVANIMPGENVTIQITYVNLLKYSEGRYEWAFPMVVGPRFTPTGGYTVPGKRGAPSSGQAPNTKAVVTDAEKITPPIAPKGTRAGHDISLSVDLDAGMALGEIKSQLHEVSVEKRGATRAKVRLNNDAEIPNRDFILRYTVAGENFQTGLLTSAPQTNSDEGHGDGYFTFIVQPPATPQGAKVTPKEIIFVIDQTGSQRGLPIRKAKETMRYLVQNMNPGDSFQLLGFNTQVFPCFDAPVYNEPGNVAKALKFLEPIEGSGGTDVLKAMEYALKIKDDPGRQRIICYLTDGYVVNEPQILDFLQKNRGRAHMFPFGIGNSVNRMLIEGMAKEGMGTPEYVDLKESGEIAAQRFYRRISSPLLTDIAVDWNGLPVADVYPRRVPDIFFAGRPTIFKGRYTKGASRTITLRGKLNGAPWKREIRVDLPAMQSGGGEAIPTLWAREKIEDLQSSDWMGLQTGEPKVSIKDQIVAVALEFKLMSHYTSFVAVEQRVVNIGGKQRTIDVPVEMADGVSHDGIFGEEQQYRNSAYLLGARVAKMGVISGRAGYGSFTGATIQSPAPTASMSAPTSGAALPPINAPNAPAAAAAPPRATATPSIQHRTGARTQFSTGNTFSYEESDNSRRDALRPNADILDNKPEGAKRLAAMKPAERSALLAQIKLAPALQGLAGKIAKEGKNGTLHKGDLNVDKNRVEVQIWLNSLPPYGLKQLEKMGFKLAATLTPKKLLLGTTPVAKLDALIALGWVRRVETPRFK